MEIRKRRGRSGEVVKSCIYKLDEETGDHTKVKLAGHMCFVKCMYAVHVVSRWHVQVSCECLRASGSHSCTWSVDPLSLLRVTGGI